MTCKPESKKQRLERIAVQMHAALIRSDQDYIKQARANRAHDAIAEARELIKQLDALPLDE